MVSREMGKQKTDGIQKHTMNSWAHLYAFPQTQEDQIPAWFLWPPYSALIYSAVNFEMQYVWRQSLLSRALLIRPAWWGGVRCQLSDCTVPKASCRARFLGFLHPLLGIAPVSHPTGNAGILKEKLLWVACIALQHGCCLYWSWLGFFFNLKFLP